ncbi:MAG TPA: phosphoglycerate dehydrogenase [Hanamia sp.]|jgi:D-3-phosphoglycerate dehydrogenase|nr:phosphoglycerate dehydrogenase [Hanamia sp.]
MPEKKVTSYPKEKINILLLENISKAAAEKFLENGYVSVKRLTGALSESDLIKEIKNVHLLGIRSKTKITPAVLEHAQKLQAIGCFCIGTNQVDLKEATNHGIAVFNAPYSNTRSVAELVIASSIFLIRRIPDKDKSAHGGIWMKESAGSHELRGKTLGIIGYGNIGSQVSVLAEAFGMKVIFYDTETKMPLGNAESKKTMKDVLKQADIVTLHVPDLPSTRNLINKTNIPFFKKGSILINYARGKVVDLDELRKALLNNDLSGAAIDVYPSEPAKNGEPFETPLQGLSNVILTPHIGGSTEEAQQNIGEDVSNKLFNFLEKGITTGSHTVPPLNLPPHENTHRILHIHKNVPGVLSEINTQLSSHKINILGQYLKTNDEIGYVVLDVNKNLSKEALELLKEVKDTIKVRLLY